MVKDDIEIFDWSDSLLKSFYLDSNLLSKLSPCLIDILNLINVQLT
jgi:hypothetical protein